MANAPLKVLLVGNYDNDGQESMLRFTEVLASHLPRYGCEVEITRPSTVFGQLRRGANGLGKWLGYLDKYFLFPRKLRNQVRRFDSNSIAHICDHSNAIYTRTLADVPHLVTCHDLLAVRAALGEWPCCKIRATGRFYQRLIIRRLNAAQRVACVSAASRRDFLRLTRVKPGRVSLIHNGLNYPYTPIPNSELGRRLRELAPRLGRALEAKHPGFILHVGGNQWYKNRLGVVQIYARLCQLTSNPPNLAMVGKPLTPELRQLVTAHGVEQRVLELNAVSNEDLQVLYSAARLFLFPSLAEGFGWPILEAQSCGCPVVIPEREPMTEVGGGAAVRFEIEPVDSTSRPLDYNVVAENGAKAVLKTLHATDEERLNRIQQGQRNAAQFSTTRMVEGYVELYRQMLRLKDDDSVRSGCRHWPADRSSENLLLH
jgi:glycosyltransferase involved in cell wall biosynthesis